MFVINNKVVVYHNISTYYILLRALLFMLLRLILYICVGSLGRMLLVAEPD